jgi:hypothetical protein
MNKKAVTNTVESVEKVLKTPPENPQRAEGVAGDKEGSAKKPKLRIRAKDFRDLLELAIRMKSLQQDIVRMQRKSCVDAITIGTNFLRVEAYFAKFNVGMTFRQWRQKNCGVPDSTASNYMSLAKHAKEKPEILKMGLTEAYYFIGIKKRQALKDVNQAAPSNPGDNATGTTDDGTTDNPTSNHAEGSAGESQPKSTTQKLGSIDVYTDKGVNVIELDSDWKTKLPEILSKLADLEPFLANGGLLIRLAFADPQMDEIRELLGQMATVNA